MFFPGSREREFRMIWKVEAEGKTNYLAGTAHFFPYCFKKSLSGLIGNAETVLFEGPLDESNMNLVRQYGLEEKGRQSFFKTLDQNTIIKINRELESDTPKTDSSFFPYIDIFPFRKGQVINPEIEGLKPWMGFFVIWTHYLRKRGWKYSVDIEAYEVAKQLGKNLYFLETIKEQISALEGIPLERIVNFFKKMDHWERVAKRHSKYYLAGKFDSMLGVTTEFPTSCESIIDKRDPVLFERMKPYLKKGNTIAFVGTIHIAGIINRLKENRYTVSKYVRC